MVDKLYLLRIGCIASRHHLLNAAVFGHLEDLQRAAHIERHDIVAVSLNLLLHALGHGHEGERHQGRGDQPLQMA